MRSIWRVVSTLVLALIVLGAVALAIGMFTGGSVNRIVELVFGGTDELWQMAEMLRHELSVIFDFSLPF